MSWTERLKLAIVWINCCPVASSFVMMTSGRPRLGLKLDFDVVHCKNLIWFFFSC